MHDYTAHFGMDFNPFIKNTHDILMETTDYKELRLRLDYLLSNKGFGLITGDPGRGKTDYTSDYH